MVTLAALDPQILRVCPSPERFFGAVLAAMVVINGAGIGLAAFLFLFHLGHELSHLILLSGAAGVWFINLQRFLLLLHGERRRRWSQLYSRVVCSLFMGFFASLVFLSLYHHASQDPIMFARFHGAISPVVVILTAQFLAPVYLRRRFFAGSVYAVLEKKERAQVILQWNKEFSERYVTFVTGELGVSGYSIPGGMLSNSDDPTD